MAVAAPLLWPWVALGQQPDLPAALRERLAPLAEQLEARTAPASPLARGVPFLVLFAGEVGEIEPGTPVTIRGIPVGRVREVGITFDTAAGTLDVPIVIELVADRLSVDGHTPTTADETYDAVAALVGEGLRARIAPAGLLGGSPRITLDLVPDAAAAELRRDAAYPLIPTVPMRADEVRAALELLIARIGALPLEQLANDAGETLVGLRDLVTGPELRSALLNLVDASQELKAAASRLETRADPLIASLVRTVDQTGAVIAQGGRTITQLGSNIGPKAPLWGQIESLLRELTGTARSLRLMTEYLERHPDAIIRGKASQTP